MLSYNKYYKRKEIISFYELNVKCRLYKNIELKLETLNALLNNSSNSRM